MHDFRTFALHMVEKDRTAPSVAEVRALEGARTRHQRPCRSPLRPRKNSGYGVIVMSAGASANAYVPQYVCAMQSAKWHGLCTLRAATEPLPLVLQCKAGPERHLPTLQHLVRAEPSALTVVGCQWPPKHLCCTFICLAAQIPTEGCNRWSRRREEVPGVQKLPWLPPNSQGFRGSPARATGRYTGLDG